MTSPLSRLVLVFSCIITLALSKQTKNNNFDIYIFTLHWPYTTCIDWMDSGEGRSCAEIEKAEWSVHGLWPTRFGEINPNFCNNSWHYQHDEMKPIMGEMERYWPDVEMRRKEDSLWSHEWIKHGTCAVLSAPETDIHNQTEYFMTGCHLAAENPLSGWLAKGGVRPHDTALYSTRQVWEAVLEGTGGFKPHIDCTKVEGQVLISEIKLCYSKTLSRVHCDGIIKDSEDMAGKCLKYSEFRYPASVSSLHSLTLSSGKVAGVVCTVLALGALALSLGYYCYRKTNRGRGYESL